MHASSVVAVGLLLASGTGWAAEGTSPAADPLKRTGPMVTASAGRGLLITSEDGNFAFGFRGRVQMRDSLTFFPTPALNEVQIRTFRLVVYGHALSPDLKYFVQLALGGGDFDRENPSPLFDAFLEYTRFRDLTIRAGQFFVPFDRARTIREFALQFVDRQQVIRELTLDRDVGVMFWSTNLFGLSERLGYHVFVGGGDGRNRFTTVGDGPLVVGRLVLRPFGLFDDDQEGDLSREKRVRLAVGLAGAYNFETSKPLSTTGNTYTAGTTHYAHAAADLVFKYAGFSLLTEFVWRRASKNVISNGTTSEATRSGYGYIVQAGYLPIRKLELVARWEQLFANRNTDSKLIDLAVLQGRQLGGGVNLYLNNHAFKVQADYFHVFGSAGPVRDQVRVQLDASF